MPDFTGLVGFEPTTHGFGDRCSSQLELQAFNIRFYLRYPSLFKLAVNDMFAAKSAVLSQFDPFRMLFLILHGIVVDALTFRALKLYWFTHGLDCSISNKFITYQISDEN